MRDIEGSVRVATVSGGVTVEDVRGRVDASAIEESIVLVGVRGVVRVQSTDGDVTLEDIDSPEVEVATVGGDLEFDGTIRREGSYTLVTHDGDVTAAVPEDVSAGFRSRPSMGASRPVSPSRCSSSAVGGR